MGVFETVEDVERVYTSSEVKMAREAKELFARMAFPSIKGLISLLRKGKIRNCKVTPRDVLNSVAIYGPDLAAVRGRSVRSRRHSVQTNPGGASFVCDEEVDLYIDIMFVNRVMFLVTVGAPMRYIMVTHLFSKSRTSLERALNSHVAKYKRQGFVVKNMFCDGESGIHTLIPDFEIQSIQVEIAGPNTHVGKVEVAIRYLKQMARSLVSTLPYQLPQSLTVWLIYHCASRSNFVPISTLSETITPREYLLGRQLDYNLDLQLKFGEYVEVFTRTSNSSAARTRPGIALVSVGNLHGSWKVLMLDTLKVATMDQWRAMPMSSSIIQLMDTLAVSRGARPLQQDLEFKLINSRPIDDLPPEDARELFMDPAARKERMVVPSPEADFTDEPHSRSVSDEVVGDEPAGAEVEQLVERDAVYHEEDHQPDESEGPVETPPVEDSSNEGAQSRYDLRPTRRYGHRDGPWRRDDSIFERGFRISAKAGIDRFGDGAVEAILKELRAILEKEVFEFIDPGTLTRAQRRRLIRGFIFLKEKFLANGEFDKLKARLVAGGHMQDRSSYMVEELASPTASLQSVFMTATLASLESRHIMTLDIGSAYLNAFMVKDVFMVLDSEIADVLLQIYPDAQHFRQDDGSIIVKLKKALYGCVESAKLWYSNISNKLISLGFKSNAKDQCIFNKVHEGKQLTVCLYVDDLLCTCADEDGLKWLKEELLKEYKEVNANFGRVHSYIGMLFDWSIDGRVSVSMSGYIADVLSSCEVVGTRATPAKSDLFNIDQASTPLSEVLKDVFRSRVAKILYLAKRVRPDILLAVNFLTTRVSAPTHQDWEKLTRVLQYLNASSDLGMTLEATKSIQLIAYADASYAVHPDFKSHSAGIISLGMGPVFVKSKKQRLNTISSTEAELVSISDILPQALWSRQWLIEQGYSIGPLTLHHDNTSAIHLAQNGPSNNERTRHIAIRYYWVKDKIEVGEVEIKYLGTSAMIADFLSKPLQGELFRKMRKLLLNWD